MPPGLHIEPERRRGRMRQKQPDLPRIPVGEIRRPLIMPRRKRGKTLHDPVPVMSILIEAEQRRLIRLQNLPKSLKLLIMNLGHTPVVGIDSTVGILRQLPSQSRSRGRRHGRWISSCRRHHLGHTIPLEAPIGRRHILRQRHRHILLQHRRKLQPILGPHRQGDIRDQLHDLLLCPRLRSHPDDDIIMLHTIEPALPVMRHEPP